MAALELAGGQARLVERAIVIGERPRLAQPLLAARREIFSGALTGTQEGDPRKAGEALLRVLESDTPPLRLLLGNAAADLAPIVHRQRLDEWARWDDTAEDQILNSHSRKIPVAATR